MQCSQQMGGDTISCVLRVCKRNWSCRLTLAFCCVVQDHARMYGGLLVLRVLTRKYEFRDDVSGIAGQQAVTPVQGLGLK